MSKSVKMSIIQSTINRLIMKTKLALLLSIITVICTPMMAQAKVIRLNPATDCSLLNAPNTMLVVHASWCPYCVAFLPVVEAVSELPQYRGWAFYQIQDDDEREVCGKTPDGFPSSYLRNKDRKSSDFVGYYDEKGLMQQLDDANTDPDLALPYLID